MSFDPILFLSFGQWLPSLGIVLAFLGLIYLEQRLLKTYEDRLNRFIVVFIYVVSFFIFLFTVSALLLIWNVDIVVYLNRIWSDVVVFFEESIGKLISTTVILFAANLILRISKIALKKLGSKEGPLQKRKKTIARVIRSTSKYLTWTIAILAILAIWGMNVAPALAGLGIIGLVIGLGAQKFIHDLISGFFIIFEQHFNVGDKIEVQGFKGEVIDIGLKTTKLKNWKGEIKILSNGEISNLINFSKETSIAVVEFGIAYRENIQNVMDLLTRELASLSKTYPQIIEPPTVSGVIELASSSVNLRVIAKTLNEQHYAVERGMRLRIKEILDVNNIQIPFPQVVVHPPKP